MSFHWPTSVPKMMAGKLLLRLLLSMLLLALLAVLVVGAYVNKELNKPLSFNAKVYHIDSGSTLRSIANELTEDGVINEPYSLYLWARYQGKGNLIRSGEYRFKEGINQQQLLTQIIKGKGLVNYQVTLIEGWNFRQFRAAINKQSHLKGDSEALSDEQIMSRLGAQGVYPEGWFFPETYGYLRGDSDFVIYRQAYELMQKHLAAAWAQRDENIQIDTPYEALTLASIIEKETQFTGERRRISGVFHNRLKKGMRLQTDPTVIYGVGEAYDGDITRKHLRTDTPYNTYTRHGLTPTPIAMPGELSLIAAVTPESTKALFFVAKGGGEHYFSETLQEHNRAVRKYILGK